jgi:hypothetical protein
MNEQLLGEIKTAYKVHSLRPVRCFFFIRSGAYNFACPLTALAIHRCVMDGVDTGLEFDGGAIDAGAIVSVEWAGGTFGEDWTNGFLDGFDGQNQAKDDHDYVEGHDLGVAAAQQLSPRDPPI